ncbi:MAG TPA: amidohydrolase [Longimicrobiales bacterium]|nr:amidohydrolase [Longimicrobiales bacterium]
MARPSRPLPTALSALLACAALACLAAAPEALPAQMTKAQVASWLDGRQQRFDEVAMRIWDLAEVGYMETESSALLAGELEAYGFRVTRGVAEIPTAFVAEFGNGKPVIGMMGEFDALPGINQDRVPFRNPIEGKPAGHACGHNLFGTASAAAAMAAAEWLKQTGRGGTVRFYGTPAEEGGSGKVYMVRAGLFDDVDAVLQWHAGDRNAASPGSNLAVKSAMFRFAGVSAHAAASPDRGRSALDGVEAMNFMANLMREHVPQQTRIHYVITDGGSAPNVVPDHAEVYYYVRHPEAETVRSIFDRLVKAAEGAAAGTGTTVEYEVVGGAYERLPVVALQELVYENLKAVGGVTYDAPEQAFAEALKKTLPAEPALGSERQIQPFEWEQGYASSDAGDVSWTVPTSTLSTATWVPGTAAHTWQAVAADGVSIGVKGMMVAAKTLAFTAVDLYSDAARLAKVRAGFLERRGADFVYRPLLGDRKPPLDYRASVMK